MDKSIKYDTVEYWQSAIKLGLRYQRIYGRSHEWARYKNMYRGFFTKGVVPVNIVFALARSIIPQIYFRDPVINVTPKKPGYTIHARVWSKIYNYLIKELWLKYEFKSLILDCFFSGRGPGIIGYDTEYGYDKKLNRVLDGSVSAYNKKGELIEFSDDVKPGMPWFKRCNPIDFVVPWGTMDIYDAPWFAFRKMRPYIDVMADTKYKNKSNLSAPFRSRLENTSNSSQGHGIVDTSDDALGGWVELWQIHDKRTNSLKVITLDHPKFLRNGFDYLQVEGLPIEVLGFNGDTDYFWWTSDVRQIEHQQYEINDIRTMAKMHRRAAILKLLYAKGMVQKDELVKLLDGDPKAAVEIDAGTTGDIRKAVAMFQSHVPPDFTVAAREVREDVREIVGFSRNQMGSFEESSGRRTAAEANIVKAASMIRINERRDIMADYIEKVIRKFGQLIADNWVEERIVDIVGDDGVKYWIRFTGREIRGEFNYAVNLEEGLPENKSTRRADALAFLRVAQNVPGINMNYLIAQYASQFDWLDVKMLLPQSEGAGRSPERPILFSDMLAKQQGVASSYPGLKI